MQVDTLGGPRFFMIKLSFRLITQNREIPMSRLWPTFATVIVLGLHVSSVADTVSTSTVFYQDVSWAPDGAKIAFCALVNQQPADVYTMVLKGKVINKLTDNDSYDGWTCWSKDGSQIYFSSKRDGNDEIYVMKADGGGAKRLTNNPARDVCPSLSADGKELVFVSDRDGNADLYIMAVDGSTTERLTSTATKEHNPQWSPTADQIACYVTVDGGNDKLMVVDAASGDARSIGSDASKNTYPSWSADGQSLIYGCSPAEGEKWVFQAMLDGSKDEKLLPLPAFYAKYSPDGKRVAYIAGAWPSSNIYVIDYTDGTLRCLTCDQSLAPEQPPAIANKKNKPGK